MIIEKDNFKVSIGSHQGKKIVIGSDHRGFELKEKLKEFLKTVADVEDIGCFSAERTDYPVYSAKIAEKVSANPFGVVGFGICGSGIGIAIPAAKFKGVYPARCLDENDAITSRKHNNTNFLALSADRINFGTAKKIVGLWLTTKFYEKADEEAYLNRFLETLRIEGKI